MRRSLKNFLGLAVSLLSLTFACVALALPQSAVAFDAGVRTPRLGDPSPGATSNPFEIPVRQSAAVPQPLDFDVAVSGFSLDPDPVEGQRIGSFDLVTDSGEFNDKAIYSNGPGADSVRSWTFDWQLGEDPITATVKDGTGLDQDGNQIADPMTTLISFTVPGNYHGFRLMGLSLRFNQQERGTPTPGVGAVNPPFAGTYLIRSRIKSVAPQSDVKVASTWAKIALPAPPTSLSVKANRKRIHAGGKVTFRIRTTNGTSDRVGIWLAGRRLRIVKVGPEARAVTWRAPRKLGGRQVRIRFKPDGGPAKTVGLRITRR